MAFVGIANLAGGDATDPEGLAPSKSRNEHPQTVYDYDHQSHTPTLSEYRYWARMKRETERDGSSLNGVTAQGVVIAARSPFAFLKYRGKPPPIVLEDTGKAPMMDNEKKGKDPVDVSVVDLPPKGKHDDQFVGLTESEVSRLTSRRELRVASWAMMFYLITTDILGPFNAPYAIAHLGLIPGILCYVFFGFIASGTGFIIGHLFCKLDSDRFPIRTFGDIAHRTVGPWFKYVCSILQSLQLVVNVGLICLSSGQSLYQVAHNHPCFSVAVVVWAIIGMIVGQIRSLRNFAIIGQCAVYLNLFIIFLSMGVVAHTPPNYAVANAADDTIGYGPPVVQAFNGGDLVGQINGMFNLVFAYGGAMIFPEMISEMRSPMSFWKGMVCADSLIMLAYLLYGVFFYCFQGQFTQANAFQGLAPYWAQTICNVLNMVSGMIAACLYGNIGIKVIYVNIVQDMFKGPPMNTKKGRWLWTGMVPLYWIVAFIVANSIPALGAMTGLIGAVCIFQFSYTFPPMMLLFYNLKVHASEFDIPYSGFGTKYVQKDSWKSMGRHVRAWTGVGIDGEDGTTELPAWATRMSRKKGVMIMLNIFLFGLTLACFACLGLGLYGTGESVKQTFAVGQGTAFGCKANA